MSGGGGAGEEEEAAMRLIKSLKEIGKLPLPDITAALRDCGMAPDKAVTRLLSQDVIRGRPDVVAPVDRFLEDKADEHNPLDDDKEEDDDDEDSPSSDDDMSLRNSTADELDSSSEDEEVPEVLGVPKVLEVPKVVEVPKSVMKKYRPLKKAKTSVQSGHEAGNKEKGVGPYYPVKQTVRVHANRKSVGYKGKDRKKNTGMASSYPTKQASGSRIWVCKECDRTFESAIALQFHKRAKHPAA